jgi:Polyketide cyclase / dehydrase and lipid transport
VIARLAAAGALGVLAAKTYDLLVDGRLTLDIGRGRRLQPLGPVTWEIAAPRTLVFDLIESPYRRTPRALAEKLHVWERSSDMVLAAHVTVVGRRRVTTVETVRFEPPAQIHFRLVRGPVPHVAEVFELTEAEVGTELTWRGELGTDLGWIGERWGNLVARSWMRAVEASIAAVKSEAETRSRARAQPSTRS